MNFDAHFHLGAYTPHKWGTLNLCQKAEWQSIHLAQENIRISCGIHPWMINDQWYQDLETLSKLLAKHPQIHVGECGIDRNSPNLEIQIDVFKAQIKLACQYQRTLCVHLVGHTQKAFELLAPLKIPIYLHSCSLRENELKQAQKFGFKIGLSPQLWRWRETRVQAFFQVLDPELLLIESDAEDSNTSLEDHIKKIAELLNRSPAEIWALSNRNWIEIY